jgi:hypothetical protein
MATAIRTASERQGFAATVVFGGSMKELEGMLDGVTAAIEAGTLRPRDARCEVLVTEALARCNAPDGLSYARLAPE